MKRFQCFCLLCASALLLVSCATAVPTYTMYPQVGNRTNDEVALVLVSSQLQVKSIDDIESEKKGNEGTVYRLLPGFHRIVAQVDFEVTPAPWEMVSTLTHDHAPYTLPHEHWVGTTYSSDAMIIEFEAEAGWLYSLRAAWLGDQVRLAVSRGKNPMTFADGTEVKIVPEKR